MAIITIKRDPQTDKVAFDPNPVKLGTGDFVVWSNHDPKAAHWPTQKGQAANWWMDDSLPSFQVGQPAATSPAVNLAGPASITYVCSLHPNDPDEQGTISF